MPQTDMRLFMETGQPDGAWADAEGQVVTIRDRGRRLYVSLNWRRGFRENKRDAEHARANNVARIHCTTPTIDRIATIAMESPNGFGGLYLCRYGDYWIAMNGSVTKSYAMKLPADFGPPLRDLVSSSAWLREAIPDLKPGATIVLCSAQPQQ